jgi:hypothetical protein
MMLEVEIRAERVFVGERFSVSFQRTQRLAEDFHADQTPPSWGALPVHAVAGYAQRISTIRDVKNSFLIPVGDDEAVWLGFGGVAWKPNAAKVGVGGRNAITGETWDERLRAQPQDYLVCPPQLSFESIGTDDRSAQIVAGSDLADAGDWEANRIRLIVYEPKRGVFPGQPPSRTAGEINILHSLPEALSDDAGDDAQERITNREVHRDPYGIETWDPDTIGSISVYMVGHKQYRRITGHEPPPSPSPSAVYQGHYLP